MADTDINLAGTPPAEDSPAIPQMQPLQPDSQDVAAPTTKDQQFDRDAEFNSLKDAHLQTLKKYQDHYKQFAPADPLAQADDKRINMMAEQQAIADLQKKRSQEQNLAAQKNIAVRQQGDLDQKKADLGITVQNPTPQGDGRSDVFTDEENKNPNNAPNPYAQAAADYATSSIGTLENEQGALSGIQKSIQAHNVLVNKLSGDYAKVVSDDDTEYKSAFNSNQKEINAISHELLNKKINPNDFMDSMGTPQKVATAIGMLVAGVGSGLLRQQNPVIKYLNDQIDRNIEAQKADMTNKRNALAGLVEQQGSLTAGTSMMRALHYAHYQALLNQAAAQSGDPATQMKVAELGNQFEQQKNKAIFDATNAKLMGSGSSVPFGMMSKEQQERYVPEYGQSATASPEVVNEFNKKTLPDSLSAMKAIDTVLNLSQQKGASINPTTRAKITAALMDVATKKAAGSFSRVTAQDVELMKEIAQDPSAIFGLSGPRVASLLQIRNGLESDLNEHAKATGLPVRRFPRFNSLGQ